MKIYFAHPKPTNNTEYELNCLEKIKDLHPGSEIVNPRDIEIEEEDESPKGYADFMMQMEKYYFPAIDSCDLVIVAKTKNGKISPGVQKEIPYAHEKGKTIEYLNVPFPEPNIPTINCYMCQKQILEIFACSSKCMSDDGGELICQDCAGA